MSTTQARTTDMVDSGPGELRQIIDLLERSLGKAEAQNLTLLAALIDHALAEAKRHQRP